MNDNTIIRCILMITMFIGILLFSVPPITNDKYVFIYNGFLIFFSSLILFNINSRINKGLIT